MPKTDRAWRNKTERRCGAPAERFASKYMPEPNSGCWLWCASVNAKGYGHFKWGAGDVRQAHRASWELHRGRVPDGQHVLHRCDNPACVNPEHLFVGSNDDNMADRIAKGRQTRLVGERNPRAILNERAVLAVRSSVEHEAVIAARLGVSRATVHAIRTGRNWRHLTPHQD